MAESRKPVTTIKTPIAVHYDYTVGAGTSTFLRALREGRIEGVMLPELYMAESLGMAGKPLFRVHTAGSVGGATAIVGSDLVGAGLHDKVLVVGWQKQSESEATWALSPGMPFHPPLMAGAGGFFAPHLREYIRRSNAPDHVGIRVAVKDRRLALAHALGGASQFFAMWVVGSERP